MEDLELRTQLKCPECKTEMYSRIEPRDNEQSEEVIYCNGCGHTEIAK